MAKEPRSTSANQGDFSNSNSKARPSAPRGDRPAFCLAETLAFFRQLMDFASSPDAEVRDAAFLANSGQAASRVATAPSLEMSRRGWRTPRRGRRGPGSD